MEILGEGIKKTAAISSLLSVQGIFWGLYIRPRLLLVTSSFYSHMATVLYQSITRNHFFFFAIVTVRLNNFFFLFNADFPDLKNHQMSETGTQFRKLYFFFS